MAICNWRNQLLVDLPMLTANHVAGTKTTNVGTGGSALDATFGAGGKTPTKLTARGYRYDGTDDYMEINDPVYGLSLPLTYLCTVRMDPLASDTLWFDQYQDNDSTVCFGFGVNATTGKYMWAHDDGATLLDTDISAQSTSGLVAHRGPVTAVSVIRSTATLFYLNGQLASTKGALTLNNMSGILRVGEDFGFFGGDYLHFGVYDGELTALQIAQYHRQMMAQLSDV